MRRTAKLVLGLAVCLLTTPLGSLALPAQARAEGPSTSHLPQKPNDRGLRKFIRPMPLHAAPHAAVQKHARQPGRVPVHKKPKLRVRDEGRRGSRLRPAVQRITRSGPTRSSRATPLAMEASLATGAAAEGVGRADVRTASLSGKRAVMPPPLRGSLDSLQRQNEKAEADSLERIEDEDDLADRIARKALVPVPTSSALTINGDLPESHRYCRPWTAQFLADLAHAHGARFHQPLEVSSAVRTVAYQKHLMAINGNAAPAEGDVVSPHLTGATIDIAKSGLGRQEIAWMRDWLLPLQQSGTIDVEEEFRQACFHITVYKNYVPGLPASTTAGVDGAQPVNAAAPASKQSTATPKKAARPKSKSGGSHASGGTAALGR